MPASAKDVSFHRLSAKVEEGSGHFAKASEEYLIAAEQDPSEENIFGEGYELILAGRPMDAAEVYLAQAWRVIRCRLRFCLVLEQRSSSRATILRR